MPLDAWSRLVPLYVETGGGLRAPLRLDSEADFMSFALDHVALFCEPGAKDELAALERAGFTAEFGRKHEGQGTANKLVLFEQNYLELIWIDQPETAAANALRLPERIERGDGASFGVALRISEDSRGEVAGWTQYRLRGFEHGYLAIRPDTFADPSLPLIFAMVLSEGVMPPPVGQGHPQSLFAHSCGASAIEGVELAGPELGELSREGIPDEVRFVEAASPALRIALAGGGSVGSLALGPFAQLA